MSRQTQVRRLAVFANAVAIVACSNVAPARSQETPAVEIERAGEKEWEILFADGITQQEYARQLDYFGIEIAAVSKSGRVEYITRLMEQRPEHRTGQRGDDPRLRIGWKSGVLVAADRRLLRKAGIASADKELTHYFPPDLQEQLQQLEIEYAGRASRDIERTRFQIQPVDDGNGYEFVVIDQVPPKAEP